MWGIEAHQVFQAVTGGGIVVVGVVLADHLHGRRSRREHVHRVALRAAHLLTHVAAGYTSSEVDTKEGSRWWEFRQELWELLGQIQARSYGFRNAKRLRQASNETLTRLGAAETALILDNRTLPRRAAWDLCRTGLREAVISDRPSLQQGAQKWRETWGL